MKWYPYLGTLGQGDMRIMYRPSLQIEITRGKVSMSQTAMVDSGSDVTLMDEDIAHVLDIDLQTCPRVQLSGVAGDSVGHVATVSVTIERMAGSMPMEVVFIKDLRTGILLGQKDFFSYFTVVFEKQKNRFGLERNTKPF